MLLEKYAKGDESSIAEVHCRVARALAEAEATETHAQWADRFVRGRSKQDLSYFPQLARRHGCRRRSSWSLAS